MRISFRNEKQTFLEEIRKRVWMCGGDYFICCIYSEDTGLGAVEELDEFSLVTEVTTLCLIR